MNFLSINKQFTKEQKEEFEQNFEPNGKDHIMVNPENPTLYVAAFLFHIYSDAIISYEEIEKTFVVKYKEGNDEYVKIVFSEDELTDTFNTFTTQLVKMCNYHGNKWTTELLEHLRWK
ncbi:hypothetical protein ACCE15_19085 [Pseudomonas parafulva]|uniref:hypothetical protein n=1 Tax=Pseudomonas parafulva TaxID=157782 RepID=UPI00356A41CC